MATGITLGDAIRVFQKELGCGGFDDEDVRETVLDAIHSALEYMLFSGGGEILREWIVTVRDGRFTFPRDLETPIKYRFGETANSGFGTVFSGYYAYSSQSVKTYAGFSEWDDYRISSNVNKVPTQFQPPKSGAHLCLTTRNKDDVGKQVMVMGKFNGLPIAPMHNGYKTAGELLKIYHESDKRKKYSAWKFDEVTAVVKDPTCSYVMLSAVLPETQEFFFLSHYHPDEEKPQYTEGRLYSNGYADCCDFQLHILGRISSDIKYVRDEELLLITSFQMLQFLAKRARYDDTGDLNEVAAYENRIERIIKKQVAYQQKSNRQLSVNLQASGHTLTNL